MVHVMGDAAFVGDTLFMPDGGSARCDFPGGSAEELYDSIQKVLALPDETRLFMCHDYGPNGRAIAWETTVGEQKEANIHVGRGQDARGVREIPYGARCTALYAETHHSIPASEHARRRSADRQRRQSNAQSAGQRPVIALK